MEEYFEFGSPIVENNETYYSICASFDMYNWIKENFVLNLDFEEIPASKDVWMSVSSKVFTAIKLRS